MHRPVLLAAFLSAFAPMQCRGNDDVAVQKSEPPGDALYDLAQDFRAKGNEQGYRETLRYIIARYPSSRRAVTARLELESDASVSDAASP